jgi:RNA polymerase sigma-70 factor, ECF subfamily
VIPAGELVQMPVEDLPAQGWTEAFHRGTTATMAAVYQEHFVTVRSAVFGVLQGADGETVIHEVFFRILSNEDLRRAYRAGSFASWLFAVSRHHAIDYARRRAREAPFGLEPAGEVPSCRLHEQIEARLLMRRFREQVLPPEWIPVFDARFVRQLDQRQAARAIGVPRTTLVYREHRIRRLLRAFLLSTEGG